MKYYLISIIAGLVVCGCSISQKMKNEKDLIEAIIKCIDSDKFIGKTIGVYKKKDLYVDYNLYFISRFYGIIVGEKYPYKIMKLKDKYVFFFSEQEKELSEDSVNQFIEEIGEVESQGTIAFYFAQCKHTGKSKLLQAINDAIEPYEIPEIRDFDCHNNFVKKENFEMVINDIDIDVGERYNLNNDIVDRLSMKFTAIMAIYNRTDSCLFIEPEDISFGYFALISGYDTLNLNVKKYYKYDSYIDDSMYIQDPERVCQVILQFDSCLSSLGNIDFSNLDNNFLRLMRDSLFYIPKTEEYEKYRNEMCIYPKEKVKVITPIEIKYLLRTPRYVYHYINSEVYLKEKRID